MKSGDRVSAVIIEIFQWLGDSKRRIKLAIRIVAINKILGRSVDKWCKYPTDARSV